MRKCTSIFYDGIRIGFLCQSGLKCVVAMDPRQMSLDELFEEGLKGKVVRLNDEGKRLKITEGGDRRVD